MTNAILLEITMELLEEQFHLPPSSIITGAQYDNLTRIFTLRVEHPDLPPVAEAAKPISITLTTTQHDPAELLLMLQRGEEE